MKIVIKLLGLFIFAFLFSCTKEYYTPPDTPPENVSFSQDVIPVFNTNCISCHSSGGTKPDLTSNKAYDELTTNDEYVVPGKPDESELYQRITGHGSMMPPSGMMPINNINIIQVWISEGALNN